MGQPDAEETHTDSARGGLAPARRDRWLFALLALAWSAVALACILRYDSWTVDDFYITYRYAENLAMGRGFVFNPGERVFGLTDPGLGLALAALRFVTRAPIEWLASFLFGGALVGTGLLLLREGARVGRRAEFVAGGSLILVSSFLWLHNGAAAPLTLFLLLAAAALADRHPWASGGLAGLAVWIRPDAGVGVALLALLLLFETRRLPWRFVLGAAITILLGALLAFAWFGAFVPNSLGAKLEMAGADPNAPAGAERFWARGAFFFGQHFGTAWLLTVAIGLLGLWPLAQTGGRSGRLLALLGGCLAVLYPVLGVPFFSWYILIPLIALLYGVPFFVGAVLRSLAQTLGGTRAATAAGACAAACALALLLAGFLRVSWFQFTTFAPSGRLTAYRQAAEWLRQSAAPEETIAYVEIGVLGYYSGRPIEDLMGIITPRAMPYVAQNDIVGAFLAKPAAYVIFHSRGRMAPIIQAPWFPAAYEKVASFKDRDFPRGRLDIFHRRAGATIP
jgi:arabinofuranosyltransferase